MVVGDEISFWKAYFAVWTVGFQGGYFPTQHLQKQAKKLEAQAAFRHRGAEWPL